MGGRKKWVGIQEKGLKFIFYFIIVFKLSLRFLYVQKYNKLLSILYSKLKFELIDLFNIGL